MSDLLSFTVIGLFTGAAYAIAASGLVLVYATTRVFNLAHGAIGMVMAFAFWQLSVSAGVLPWVALLLVVGVLAPLTGLIIERLLMRGLGTAPVSVSLVVTVGLFVALIGLAQTVWPPEARLVEEFFPFHSVQVFGVTVSYHQLLTMGMAVLVAVGLSVLLERTRAGLAMRAAVDDPGLLALYGGRPNQVSRVSWALGTALGALAGILLTPSLTLDYYQLTLLVINAYAAAVLGRLRSLPLTFAGAIVLGLGQAYAVGYLPTTELYLGLRAVVPVVMLFAVLVVLPAGRLRPGPLRSVPSPAVPSLVKSAAFGAALVGAVVLVSFVLSDANVLVLGAGLGYAILMLSLVVLTGYGGHVSLAQLSFAGVGAVTVARLGNSSPWALAAAVLVAALAGVVVALPVARLTGLYLALATFAFGVFVDKMVFQSDRFGFGVNNGLPVSRVFSVESDRGYLALLAVVFVALAVGVLGLRRGRFGRRLLALRDSPAGASTLGLDPHLARLLLFAGSAGLAGLGGALLGGLEQTAGATDFQVMSSLPLLLFAVVFGVTTVTGALVGGLGLALLPVAQSHGGVAGGVFLLVLGVAAVTLARNPNGLVPLVLGVARDVNTGLTGPPSGRHAVNRHAVDRPEAADPAPRPDGRAGGEEPGASGRTGEVRASGAA